MMVGGVGAVLGRKEIWNRDGELGAEEQEQVGHAGPGDCKVGKHPYEFCWVEKSDV